MVLGNSEGDGGLVRHGTRLACVAIGHVELDWLFKRITRKVMGLQEICVYE